MGGNNKISTVSLLGQAGDIIAEYPEFRIVHIESREPFNEDSFFSQIPVMYWDRTANNPLLKIPNRHFVVLFGRLESHPKLGLFVIVEQMRHFQSNLKIHNQPKQEK